MITIILYTFQRVTILLKIRIFCQKNDLKKKGGNLPSLPHSTNGAFPAGNVPFLYDLLSRPVNEHGTMGVSCHVGSGTPHNKTLNGTLTAVPDNYQVEIVFLCIVHYDIRRVAFSYDHLVINILKLGKILFCFSEVIVEFFWRSPQPLNLSPAEAMVHIPARGRMGKHVYESRFGLEAERHGTPIGKDFLRHFAHIHRYEYFSGHSSPSSCFFKFSNVSIRSSFKLYDILGSFFHFSRKQIGDMLSAIKIHHPEGEKILESLMLIFFFALLGHPGSFLQVVAQRSISGTPWWGKARSVCPECGHPLMEGSRTCLLLASS